MMKVFAAIVALTGVAVAAAIVLGAHKGTPDSATALMVASPADTFVVHDAPAPAKPAAPAVPAPAAAPAPPDAPPSDTLDAAIERLRAAAAAKPDVPPPVAATPVIPPVVTPPLGTPSLGTPAVVTPGPGAPTIDPLLNGPSTTPVLSGPPVTPPRQTWTAVTSQGARWRGSLGSADPTLVIDMGGGRIATVHVDPAFQALPLDAANARVDFLKETILVNFPPGAAQFRYLRDGSVMMQR